MAVPRSLTKPKHAGTEKPASFAGRCFGADAAGCPIRHTSRHAKRSERTAAETLPRVIGWNPSMRRRIGQAIGMREVLLCGFSTVRLISCRMSQSSCGRAMRSWVLISTIPSRARLTFLRICGRTGMKIYFVLYDLLPILLPQAFPPGFATLHARWVSVLSKYADGVVCISRFVADEFAKWLNANGAPRGRPLQIGWFHLGSDVKNSVSTYGLPEHAEETLGSFAARPSFLMVGTIEPRKGHAQTLGAFEWLWQSGHELNLIIVGKQGWMVETFCPKATQSSRVGQTPVLVGSHQR